jgi:hypothetical protein
MGADSSRREVTQASMSDRSKRRRAPTRAAGGQVPRSRHRRMARSVVRRYCASSSIVR